MVKIFTIIATYNGAEWIEKCIESLLSSSIKTEVIIVDNASTDNTLDLIKKKFESVIILKQEENLRFGKANNVGLSFALKNEADYVFLLNQDAYIEENSLEKLVKISQENPDFGILSPFHLNWEGTLLEHYFEKFIGGNVNLYSDYILKKQLNKLYKIPFVNAAAWLIPKNILKIVGGFDPIFHHYGEDNNFCQRITYHGFKIGVVPNTFIFHDSKIRKEPTNYLFSEAYFHNEVKDLQIKYADINKQYSNNDFNIVRRHIKKLITINLLKFKFNNVRGYLKKYKIFEEAFEKINKSRKHNSLKDTHYLDKII